LETPKASAKNKPKTEFSLATANRFNALQDESTPLDDYLPVSNGDNSRSVNGTSPKLITEAIRAKRPNPVVSAFPERNITFRRGNTVPGNSTYSEVVKNIKRVTVFSDSIARGIRKREFNSFLKSHSANFHAFPGTTARQLAYHMIPYISEEAPDVAILHVGTNNLSPGLNKPQQTATEIANEIIRIGDTCKKYGVNDILISSLTIRKNFSLRKRVAEINNILQEKCTERGYVYIDNSNVIYDHLWDDGIHLVESGKAVLANNFIFAVNSLNACERPVTV
jgi:lysophospholipase L1-like esterase